MYKTLCQVLRKIQKWAWHSIHAQEAQNLQGVADTVPGYTGRMRGHFVVRKGQDSRGEQNREHTASAYYVLGTAPESSHPILFLPHKNPARQAQSCPPYIHRLRFGKITCPRSHSQSAAEGGFKPRAVTPAPRLFLPS